MEKRALGQFYTTVNPFDHPAFRQWAKNARLPQITVLEPFAGADHLIQMLRSLDLCTHAASYDIQPGASHVIQQDVLKEFPKNFSAIVTNPPYLAKNAAKRQGLPFPATTLEDLYEVCLEQCLQHAPYVAAIIPEAFLTKGRFLERLDSSVRLAQQMFDDTDHPVCLALWGPDLGAQTIWEGSLRLGSLSELSHLAPKGAPDPGFVFNVPNGPIGLSGVDNTKGPSIAFHEGHLIPSEEIKHSSRAKTRIGGIKALEHEVLRKAVIDAANEKMFFYRENTKDVLLTPFKGRRADGRYRRRLDFAQARKLLQEAWQETLDRPEFAPIFKEIAAS